MWDASEPMDASPVNPYAVHNSVAAIAPHALAPARALMRHRLFALMHAAVVVLLLVILGTILRSGGLSASTALPVLGLVVITLYMAATSVLGLLAKPVSLPMGIFADLACMCTCIFIAPAIWSVALRFGSGTLHSALVDPVPLSAWSPHWPTVIFLPLLTALNLFIPTVLFLGMIL